MKSAPALVLALSACASLGGSGSSAPASPSSYSCAAQAVQQMGYHLFGADSTLFSGQQAFTATRRLRSTGIGQTIGEISVRVTTAYDTEGKIYVSPARYEEIPMSTAGEQPPTTATPGIGGVIGGTPGTDQVAGTPPRRRGVNRRRMSPGPVAEDAGLVLDRCSSGTVRMARLQR